MTAHEWSEPFSLTVRYKLQITPELEQQLHEMRDNGASEKDLADEIACEIALGHVVVNVIDADAELDGYVP